MRVDVTGNVTGIGAPADAVLAAVMEATSQAIVGVRPDGIVASWNRGAERIFGHQAGEVVGRPFVDVFPANQRGVLARALAGEHAHRVAVEVQRKDGMAVPVALSLASVRADVGKGAHDDPGAAGWVAIVDELTEIRSAQAALAEVEVMFREWEALAHVGRWLWDVASGSVQWSDELHRMHGVDPRAFGGTLDDHLACIHPDDRERIRARIAEVIASGHSFDDVYRVVSVDGTTRWLEVRAEPTVDSTGEVVGLRGVSRDRADVSGDR